MAILAYDGIPTREIGLKRTTSEGKTYSLDHPDELLISMRYNGVEKSTSNSQGWERSSTYYFSELRRDHPEYFSRKNIIRLDNGESPKVDAQFIKYFPQYKGYENEVLVHHHIGKDGQAVALPATIHKGSGEIHVIEDELGITQNAQRFSSQCKQVCINAPTFVGKNADEFKAVLPQLEISQKQNAFSKARIPNQPATHTNLQAKNAFQRVTGFSSDRDVSHGHDSHSQDMSHSN